MEMINDKRVLMLCRKIIDKLETLAMPDYAEEWDNVGLLVGDLNKEIKSIYIGLDATDTVIDDAIQKKADMIITHHPMIFSPLKKIVDDDIVGRRIIKLIKNDISYYTMHTNFDLTVMADIAADRLGLQDKRILGAFHKENQPEMGFGRVGKLPSTMLLPVCADYVKKCFQLEHVKIYGNLEKKISLAAIVPGSGKSMIGAAIKEKADVLITGDIGHHEGLDAMMQDLAIIDAGHYGIEHIFVGFVADYMQGEWNDLMVYQEPIQNPFLIM